MKPYRFQRAPRRVRKAQFDNVALVPANLLPFKEQYQAIANELPSGGTLIVLPATDAPHKRALKAVGVKPRRSSGDVFVQCRCHDELRHSGSLEGLDALQGERYRSG